MYPLSPKLTSHPAATWCWASSLCRTAGPCWLSILNAAVNNLSLPKSVSLPHCLLTPATINSISKSVSLFLFCKQVHLYHFFLESTYRECYMMFLLLWLTSPSMIISSCIPEKEKATHSSILAWRIPWTEEPGGLPSMGLHSQARPKWLSISSRSCFRVTANGIIPFFLMVE